MNTTSLSLKRRSHAAHRLPLPSERQDGIALMVVFVIFVVLYVVVFQLSYSTKMEETLARVRYGMVEADMAQSSTIRYSMTLILEDFVNDSGGGGGGAAPMGGAPEANPPGPADPDMEDPQQGRFERIDEPAAGGGANAQWFDFPKENLFLPNERTFGDSKVKITVRDAESRFALDRLFEYARLPGEEGVPGVMTEEEAVDAVLNSDTEEEAAESLRQRLLSGSRTNRQRQEREAAADDAEVELGPDGQPLAPGGPGTPGFESDYDIPEPLERPPEEIVEATIEMLYRAILMMISINEDNGYRYELQHYDSQALARNIVEYVIDRQMELVNNQIHLLSELLNVDGVTPELFFGPVPPFSEDEEIIVGDGFILTRDEFGDIVPTYPLIDETYDEAMDEQLTALTEQFGGFMDFPASGLDPLRSNALTRGMSAPIVEIDDNGEEYVVEPPHILGLKDVFTTYSTGKINLNTASVPVLFGLLPSLTEDEAKDVAHNIHYYRTKMQEIQWDDEGEVGEVEESTTPDLGQPRRQPPPEEDPLTGAGLGDLSGLTSLQGMAGYDPMLAAASGESTYQNIETNYFTNLQQLELIDGTDGGPDDMLSSNDGVERVDEEDDSLLRRVLNDYQKVMVFGSTYFEVELKSKTGDSRTVKTGNVSIRRDPKRGMVEILKWKELER